MHGLSHRVTSTLPCLGLSCVRGAAYWWNFPYLGGAQAPLRGSHLWGLGWETEGLPGQCSPRGLRTRALCGSPEQTQVHFCPRARSLASPGNGAGCFQQHFPLAKAVFFFFFFQNQPLLPLVPNPSPQLSDKQISQPPAVSVWVIPTRTLATLDLILSPTGGISSPRPLESVENPRRRLSVGLEGR